jgi:glutamyl-tRNA synthetase
VIRGEDHIPNTPKQVILYRALGWKPPKFAHLPLILGSDQTPLSKRHGATSLSAFREAGYLPETMVNYLALLGWSPGDDTEFLPPAELIRRFSLKRVIKRAAVFDYRKLNWLNGKYLRLLPPEKLAELARPAAEEAWGREKVTNEKLAEVAALLGARLKTSRDLVVQGDYFFRDEIDYQPEAVEKYWSDPTAAGLLREVKDVLAELPAFDRSSLENAFAEIIKRKGIKAGELFHPLRVALTGRADSPGVFEILLLLGRETGLKRISASLDYLRGRGGK